MNAPDTPTAIPGPEGEPPFQIGDELTVYEAALVYTDRHPYPQFFGLHGRNSKRENLLTWLRLGLSRALQGEAHPTFLIAKEGRWMMVWGGATGRRFVLGSQNTEPWSTPYTPAAWYIFCQLQERIKCREIKPIRPAHNHAGKIDPYHTVIRTADLAKLAIERDEQPKYLGHLLGETTNIPLTPAAAKLTEPDIASQKRRSRQRGPKRDSVGYSRGDRELYAVMDGLTRERGSAYAAALSLVDEGKVAGAGSRESKAKRLAARYLGDGRHHRRLIKTR